MTKRLHPALILIDLETTGLDPNLHEIVDTCAIILSRKLEHIAKFHALSYPDYPRRASPKALEINGYTKEEWSIKGAITQKELAHTFSDFIYNTLGSKSDNVRLIPVGHRIRFDTGFIGKLMENHGLEIPMDTRRFIDTLVLEDCIRVAKSIAEDKCSRSSPKSFERLAATYNVSMGNECHTAEGDVAATLKVLRKQIDLITKGVGRRHRQKQRRKK